ncbi:spore protease YyaC [Aquibacillus saliphilus]|uniref:spore protease YyaC n=1 Tax=Aquibacillus saliphilus TaxID=1909422 RepID=UPI001CF07486|nr:spore protease YyaC [Aquibacillus saliphilus]
MNLMNKFSSEEERFNYTDPIVSLQIRDSILKVLPYYRRDIIVVCIGTDRSTGDALGPLTGTLISERKIDNFTVFGTLENPVHAVNLNEKLMEINNIYNKPFIIAIDACLGKAKSIGTIVTARGPIKPGAALKKKLPDVGDMHVTGIVNISGYMEYFVLQNTRLHTVMQMSKKIADSFHLLDSSLTIIQNKANHFSTT